MKLLDLQILFQRKIEDVNPIFAEAQKPSSFEIENYLNKAIDRYLMSKYLALPTFEQRLASIELNFDELSQLTVPKAPLQHARTLGEYNWSTRGNRYRAPENILIPFSLSCTVTRTQIYPMTDQLMFADFVSRKQAERLVSGSNDKAMFPKPICVWEDPFYIMIIGDAYTTEIKLPFIGYIRKPYILSHDYKEIVNPYAGGNIDITAITNGSFFLAMSNSIYVDKDGAPKEYYPGDKVTKVAGYNTVSPTGVTGEIVKVGYPWGLTDTPDLPDYLHESLVEMATQMFLEEAKFKLVSKPENQ